MTGNTKQRAALIEALRGASHTPSSAPSHTPSPTLISDIIADSLGSIGTLGAACTAAGRNARLGYKAERERQLGRTADKLLALAAQGFDPAQLL
jgi:hypothetical protein